MSNLRVGDDDHPLAAVMHLRDAQALHNSNRPDGCAYHAGYVVECSLKTVLLHDDAWDAIAGEHDAAKLHACHKKLSGKSYGHRLAVLAAAQLGAVGAKYWPDLPMPPGPSASVFDWKETLRYRGEDPDFSKAVDRATAYLEWAEHVHACSIVAMRLDGVI